MERLAWFGIGSDVASPEQLSLLRAEMLVTGAVAVLAVLLASASLLTAGPAPGPGPAGRPRRSWWPACSPS